MRAVKTSPELPFAGNLLNFPSGRGRYRVDIPAGSALESSAQGRHRDLGVGVSKGLSGADLLQGGAVPAATAPCTALLLTPLPSRQGLGERAGNTRGPEKASGGGEQQD